MKARMRYLDPAYETGDAGATLPNAERPHEERAHLLEEIPVDYVVPAAFVHHAWPVGTAGADGNAPPARWRGTLGPIALVIVCLAAIAALRI